MSTAWDYSGLAAYYDKRADYAPAALDQLIARTTPNLDVPVADIGAGTAKLTRALVARGFQVHAVEPNLAMRSFGERNTAGMPVVWSEGTGEQNQLPSDRYELVTFGSSFNVTDRARTLDEVARILVPGGWFACMWNHRDLEDPLQSRIESAIVGIVPGYEYGVRREDQTSVIAASGLFEPPIKVEGRIVHTVSVADYLDAWRSHATLQRQAGAAFSVVIEVIARELHGRNSIKVPYTTRVWIARGKR